jgi:NAD(P)-dependent dehydrogenase (short-subunit alcohol dehydrogenase family)
MAASSYDLTGRVALVTGAARGIGFETARALRARGAQVAIADLDKATVEAAAASLGGDVFGLVVDVTSQKRMVTAVERVVKRFGKLDVVVANAGIAPMPATARLMDGDEFERVLEVDLMGVWRTVAPALPQIVENRGHIVVVASVYAFTNGMGNAPYAMAKAGVEALGRTLRTELSLHGASATTAYFGFIDTEMVHAALDRNPLGEQMMDAAPKLFHKRLPPSAAGEGIVRAIERRAARVILPRRWQVLFFLRGILGPVGDELAVKHKPVVALLRRLDTRE